MSGEEAREAGGPGWRGDEARLYRELAPELRGRMRGLLRGVSPDVLDDACSAAWEKFAEAQVHAGGREVRRDSALAWLTTVAKHEAFHALRGPKTTGLDAVADVPARRDDIGLWLELDEALATARELTPRMREVVGDRLLGLTYRETAELRGRTFTNTNKWVQRANARIEQVRAERDSDDRGQPKRGAELAGRLDELERDPPRYLRAALGAPPAMSATKGRRSARLAWRRAALTIERYRAEHGIGDPARAFGPEPSDPGAQRSYQAAQGAVQRAREQLRPALDDGLER